MAARKKPSNFGLTQKEATPDHEAFAQYITTTTGVEIDAETVALVQRAYPVYLKSPEKVAAAEALKAAREAAKQEAENRKNARLKARLDKIEAERQKVLRELGIESDEDEADEESFEVEVTPEPAPKKGKVNLTLVQEDLDDEDEDEDESDEDESAPWDDEDEDEEDF